MPARAIAHPVTPDGRYFVVRGRLWRMTNPALPAPEREQWVQVLSRGRALLRRAANAPARVRKRAREQVNTAKVALGERGPVWWTDGTPDYNRHLAVNTPYRTWYEGLDTENAS